MPSVFRSRPSPRRAGAVAAIAGALAVPLAAPAGAAPALRPQHTTSLTAVAHLATGTVPSLRPFAATSVFNAPLAPVAPLDPASAADVAKLAHQVAYSTTSSPVRGWYAAGYGTSVSNHTDAVPVFTVPANQPRVPVAVVGKNGPQPAWWGNHLADRFTSVPVPTGVSQIASSGSDSQVVIWQPSTDTMWEFWRFAGSPATGYSAFYGDRIDAVSTSSGVLANNWGARATSLALLGGVIRMSDLLSGVIPHALDITLPVLQAAAVAPATRNDGPWAANPAVDFRDALTEGDRFRLPAGFNCDGLADPRPLLRMICVAARDYGIIVVDKSTAVNMAAEDPITIGTPYQSVTTNPYRLFPSTDMWGPTGVLNHFPWTSLQQLSACSTGGCAPDPVSQG